MAVADFFLKIEGIEGESADDKHKGEIDILSWSFGASQSGTHASGGGGGTGKVSVQDLHVVMKVNKASPKILQACCTGEHLKKAVLTARKAGKEQQEYLKMTLTDVLVSGYSTGAASGGDPVPTEQVSLNFSKVEMEYKEQKPDGTLAGAIKAGWDLKANKPV